MTEQKVSHIEISIGKLPKWYLEDEGNNDIYLEAAVEEKWHKNPAFEDAQIHVEYNYGSDYAIVKAFNKDGDQLWERDNHDYSYALDYAKRMN